MHEVDGDQREGDGLPTDGPILSIDWGTKRIGVALSNPQQTLAHPIGVLTRRTGQRFPLKQLRPYIEEHQPIGVLVGLPLEAGGSEGNSAKAARATAAVIREKTKLPVGMFDERMTTARVLKSMNEETTRQSQRGIDGLAATVLLQSFLETRRS